MPPMILPVADTKVRRRRAAWSLGVSRYFIKVAERGGNVSRLRIPIKKNARVLTDGVTTLWSAQSFNQQHDISCHVGGGSAGARAANGADRIYCPCDYEYERHDGRPAYGRP